MANELAFLMMPKGSEFRGVADALLLSIWASGQTIVVLAADFG
jgi:hypothetical protein